MIPISGSTTSVVTNLRTLNKTIASTKQSSGSDSVSLSGNGLQEIASSLADIHNTLNNASASDVTSDFLNQNINTLRSLQSKMGDYDAASGFVGAGIDQLEALRSDLNQVSSSMLQLSAVTGAIEGLDGVDDVIDTEESRVDGLSRLNRFLSAEEGADFTAALGELQAEFDALEGGDNQSILEGTSSLMEGLTDLGDLVNGFTSISARLKSRVQGRIDSITANIDALPEELTVRRAELEESVSGSLQEIASKLKTAASSVKQGYEALPEPTIAPPEKKSMVGHHMTMGIAVKFSMIAEGGKASDLEIDTDSIPFFKQMKQRPEDNIYLTRKDKTPLEKKIDEVRGGGHINWDRWEELVDFAKKAL